MEPSSRAAQQGMPSGPNEASRDKLIHPVIQSLRNEFKDKLPTAKRKKKLDQSSDWGGLMEQGEGGCRYEATVAPVSPPCSHQPNPKRKATGGGIITRRMAAAAHVDNNQGRRMEFPQNDEDGASIGKEITGIESEA